MKIKEIVATVECLRSDKGINEDGRGHAYCVWLAIPKTKIKDHLNKPVTAIQDWLNCQFANEQLEGRKIRITAELIEESKPDDEWW